MNIFKKLTFFLFCLNVSVSRRLGTQSARTMSGTHVARGNAGGGLKLASRTRTSVGKNTGMNQSVFEFFLEVWMYVFFIYFCGFK